MGGERGERERAESPLSLILPAWMCSCIQFGQFSRFIVPLHADGQFFTVGSYFPLQNLVRFPFPFPSFSVTRATHGLL